MDATTALAKSETAHQLCTAWASELVRSALDEMYQQAEDESELTVNKVENTFVFKLSDQEIVYEADASSDVASARLAAALSWHPPEAIAAKAIDTEAVASKATGTKAVARTASKHSKQAGGTVEARRYEEPYVAQLEPTASMAAGYMPMFYRGRGMVEPQLIEVYRPRVGVYYTN